MIHKKTFLELLKSICENFDPNTYMFGNCDICDRITLAGVMSDQCSIGWINFTLGRWSQK